MYRDQGLGDWSVESSELFHLSQLRCYSVGVTEYSPAGKGSRAQHRRYCSQIVGDLSGFSFSPATHRSRFEFGYSGGRDAPDWITLKWLVRLSYRFSALCRLVRIYFLKLI